MNNRQRGVGRPRLKRHVTFNPKIRYFKPRGVALSDLKVICLEPEELEVLRLKNIEKFDQFQCAKKMKTSPATIQRLLAKANEKITLALTKGMAIEIKE